MRSSKRDACDGRHPSNLGQLSCDPPDLWGLQSVAPRPHCSYVRRGDLPTDPRGAEQARSRRARLVCVSRARDPGAARGVGVRRGVVVEHRPGERVLHQRRVQAASFRSRHLRRPAQQRVRRNRLQQVPDPRSTHGAGQGAQRRHRRPAGALRPLPADARAVGLRARAPSGAERQFNAVGRDRTAAGAGRPRLHPGRLATSRRWGRF